MENGKNHIEQGQLEEYNEKLVKWVSFQPFLATFRHLYLHFPGYF
jgi:hypothetical protein